MTQSLSYQELQEAYLALQSRVTRFSSKEQELINAQDMLDQELVGYRRMNDFHALAIEAQDVPNFMALVAETVVDLFETEIGFCCLRQLDGETCLFSHLEGGGQHYADALMETIGGLGRDAKMSFEMSSATEDVDAPIGRYMLAKRSREGSGLELVVVAAVSRLRSQTYAEFNRRAFTLFQLFVDSSVAYLESILTRDRVKEQLETIRKSELEQRRLSLIATKTHSGVIITDAKGRIVWVNEAFQTNTGYVMAEILGKKPREFLQSPELNSPETMHKLSRALRKRENITIDLKNSRKDGSLFYIRLNITPVFDQDEKLVSFIALQEDITAQKENEAKMMEKNEELTKINQELDQFVYSISHDLRAPLLSIQGLLGLIETDRWTEENREYLQLIDESTQRLDHTILEILNYSRNARLDITWIAFNLRSFIQDILTDLQSMRLDVITEVIWSGEEQVYLDEVRVGVLLNNLLSNAIKYSKRGQDDAKVRVRVETTPEECVIAIEDNGEGIEEAHLNSVFDMFFRASNSSPGTGLGLYICKEITDKLGGGIVLTSEKGIGTTVTTTLPQIEHGQIPSD